VSTLISWSTPAFARYVSPRRRCAVCNRNIPLRKNGKRIKHRVEADNPLAPYCMGDDE